MTQSIDESTYEQYLAALLGGNRTECARIVQALVSAGTGLISARQARACKSS